MAPGLVMGAGHGPEGDGPCASTALSQLHRDSGCFTSSPVLGRRGSAMRHGPRWWDWPLELGAHIRQRMVDRGFSEIDLREMMETATALRPDVIPGRWIVEIKHDSRPWSVVVEPDSDGECLVVITAFPKGR
ncbi:MAG TPA: DUF4258 domain-containing protein [Planctomycetota bacterium]